MGNKLKFHDLSENIDQWQGLPLSLNGQEVVPLDYNAGKTGWIIYGQNLNKTLLATFQSLLDIPIVVVSSWIIESYQVIRIAGVIPKNAKEIATQLKLDISSIDNLPTLQSSGLLVMDMDSTAISIECIDEIAKLHGVGKLVSGITEEAMRGELDFSESLRKRVGTLNGVDISLLDSIKNSLPITPGLPFLISQLKRYNWKVAIVSGGFTYFANYLKEKFQLDAVFANELDIDDNGKLTGKVNGKIVDAKFKARTLQNLATEFNIPAEQTVAIGDGANDLMMLRIAELGVAYHGKPKVINKSKVSINHADLTGLMCILSASLDGQK